VPKLFCTVQREISTATTNTTTDACEHIVNAADRAQTCNAREQQRRLARVRSGRRGDRALVELLRGRQRAVIAIYAVKEGGGGGGGGGGVELLEVEPNVRLGWFVLGMGINDAISVLRRQFVPRRPKTQVLYSASKPLERDVVIRVSEMGLQLRFDAKTQRLVLVDVFDVEKSLLSYSSTSFAGPPGGAKHNLLELYNLFGPTYPGSFERDLDCYVLRYQGLCLMFTLPEKYKRKFMSSEELPLELPNGESPKLCRVMVYNGLEERKPRVVEASEEVLGSLPLAPELSLTSFGPRYLEEVCLKIHADGSPTTIQFLRRLRNLKLGSSMQEVVAELGHPAKVFFKSDRRMQIHGKISASTPSSTALTSPTPNDRNSPSMKARSRLQRVDTPPVLSPSGAAAGLSDVDYFSASDYFLNYFDLGLDLLIDGATHRLKKVVAHSNLPGHSEFSQYNKCEFRVVFERVSIDADVDIEVTQTSDKPVIITPDMKWADVEVLLGPSGKPMIHDSGVVANPFGATHLYAYEGCVFEVARNGCMARRTQRHFTSSRGSSWPGDAAGLKKRSRRGWVGIGKMRLIKMKGNASSSSPKRRRKRAAATGDEEEHKLKEKVMISSEGSSCAEGDGAVVESKSESSCSSESEGGGPVQGLKIQMVETLKAAEESMRSPTNEGEFLEGLERKQDIFNQLWKGIEQLQSESGQSADAWKKKQKQLSKAQRRANELEQEKISLQQRADELQEQLQQVNERLATEVTERETVSKQLAGHKETAQQVIKDMESSRHATLMQLKECKQKEETLRLVAEKRVLELKEARRKTEELEASLKAKDDQIQALDPDAAGQRDELREKLAMLEAQRKSESAGHEEMSKHLAELSTENWNLKDSIKQIKAASDTLRTENEELQAARDRNLKKHEDTVNKLKGIHEDLLDRLKRTESRLADSREAAQLHGEKLEDHVQSLQEQLKESKADLDHVKARATDTENELKTCKQEHEEQLEKMRVAMRQVQDKHLQDVIRFDEQRKKLEDRAAEDDSQREALAKANAKLEEKVSQLEEANATLTNDTKASREKWTAEIEQQYQTKITEMLASHATESQDLQTKLAEAKAAVRNEAREAQRYKNTLAKAAKEEHAKLTSQITKANEEAAKAKAALTALEKEFNQVNQTAQAAEKSKALALAESQAREEELQRALVATQHQVTANANTHARDSEKLRADVDKQRQHVKAVEQEKRDLIVELKTLNEEILQVSSLRDQEREKSSKLEQVQEKLQSEVTRLKQELRLVENESEERIDSLQQEIDEHVASRREALTSTERLRNELKEAKKEAAKQVSGFSERSEQLSAQVEKLSEEFRVKQLELEQVQDQAAKDRATLEGLQERSNSLNDVHSQEVSDLLSQLEQVEQRAKEAESAAQSASAEILARDQEIQALEANQTNAKMEATKQAKVMRELEISKQQSLERVANEEESNRLLKLEINRRKEDFAELNKQLSSERAEKKEAERQARTLETRLLTEKEQLNSALQTAKGDLGHAKKEARSLQMQLAALQESSDQNMQSYIEEMKAQEAEKNQLIDQLRNELKDKDSVLLDERAESKRQLKHAKLEAERKGQEAEHLAASLKAAQENGVNLLQELEEKTGAYDGLTVDFESLSNSLQNLQKRLSSTESARRELEEELEQEKKVSFDLRSELQNTEAEVRNKLRSETESHQETKIQLTSLEQEKEWLTNETNIKISALNRQIQTLQDDLKRKDQNLDMAEQKFLEEQKAHSAFREAANQSIAKVRTQTSSEQNDQRQELEEVRERADKASRLCAQMEQERASLQKRVKDVTHELQVATSAQEDLRQEHAVMVTSYKEMTGAKRKLENEVKKLRLELTALPRPDQKDSSKNVDDMVLKAEQDAYHAAKKEFQDVLRRMEDDHRREIESVKEQYGRRDSLFNSIPISSSRSSASMYQQQLDKSERRISSSSSTASSPAKSVFEASQSFAAPGPSNTGTAPDRPQSVESTDSAAEYFEAGPRPPSTDEELKVNTDEVDPSGSDLIRTTERFLEARKHLTQAVVEEENGNDTVDALRRTGSSSNLPPHL
ncbi:PHAF1 protein At3g51130, partial [Durusdinium trenchii]